MARHRLAIALVPALALLLASTEGRAATVVRTSAPGGRNHCPADTSAGVALVESKGEGACLLGKTWGYDDKGLWVSDGCGGAFVLGQTEPEGATTPAGTTEPAAPKQKKGSPPGIETWGEFDPGDGFLVGLDFYPWNTRNHRLNFQLMDVNHSPASSTFGYYVGGQDGTTVTTASSVFF